MAMEKYRVHEVAKDFGLPTKDIMEILTKYAQAPKNHMQALTEEELNIVFEAITRDNQIPSLDVVFAEVFGVCALVDTAYGKGTAGSG